MEKNRSLLLKIIQMEFKSFLRIKILRYNVLLNIFWIAYSIFFMIAGKNVLLRIIWSCFLAIIPSIGLCAHIFAKDGYYYEALATRLPDFSLLVKGKVIFLTITTLFCVIFILPVLILYTPYIITLVFVSTTIYNIGFGIYITLYISAYDDYKINPNASPLFNYQGISFLKIIFFFPVVSPLLIWEKTRFLGIILMGIIGLTGLILRKILIWRIAANLLKRKYKYLSIPVNKGNF